MNIVFPTAKELFDAGVHVGHQVRRWNPRSKAFVYDHRHGISIINLEKTLQQLQKACAFAGHLVAGGGEIWFVGTKPQARDAVKEAAREIAMPFTVVRWLGGTLTNFATINRGLQKYRRLLRMDEKGEIDAMPNKEAAALRREMARMQRNFEGLATIESLPSALFVVDIGYEIIAVKEARRMGIPVLAIADTNADPTLVDYPIPANDDSVRSIRILVTALASAIREGLDQREMREVGKTSSMVKRESIELEAEVTLSDGALAAIEALGNGEEETPAP
jgi:small subunit ribosomal protein S2